MLLSLSQWLCAQVKHEIVFPADTVKTDTSRVITIRTDSPGVDVIKTDTIVITDSPVVKPQRRNKDTVAVVVPPKIDPYKVTTYMNEVPFKRRYFHEDKIDKELKRADAADGIVDNHIRFFPDTAQSDMLTKAILVDGAFLQVMIENMPQNDRDSFADNQERIRCLNAVFKFLSAYNNDGDKKPEYYKKLVANLHDMLVAFNEGKLASFTVKNTNVYTLDNSKVLFENYKDLRAYIYTEMGKKDPKMMIRRLPEYAYDTFATAIVALDARLETDLIYSYATSTNPPLTNAVHRSTDPYVQAIVKIADHSKSPLKAMAFLNDLISGRKTIAEIDKITGDADLYFKNLVRLRLENDSIGRGTYSKELALRSLNYVRKMNELHESPDAERFKCIEGMTTGELYFVMVYGQDEIYTSSFLGSFKRLLEKMKPLKGDEMLDGLNYDHFRTFIRMCAGYNTLSEFLATMNDTARSTLMANFISNLQKGAEYDLEDAVDVADAFGSISDSTLAAFLRVKVKENYELSYKEKSRKGVIIYSLLSRLFDGNKTATTDTGALLLSARLGLNNINKVPFNDMVGDSGIIHQRVFFFGDEDGKHSYEHFTDQFRKDKKWRIVTEKYWSVISSLSGKKIVIYANLPLPEPEDDDAIDSLTSYLATSHIYPSIMIHRGHSYHLQVSLANLDKHVKVVILGSCGGYHNLAAVLDKSPDAHIVSSKQTGTMGVNDEILKSLNNSLIAGQDANWISMWRGIEVEFNKKVNAAEKEKFSDYVPPYKNLGAIFIKAYRRMMASDL